MHATHNLRLRSDFCLWITDSKCTELWALRVGTWAKSALTMIGSGAGDMATTIFLSKIGPILLYHLALQDTTTHYVDKGWVAFV